MNKRNVSGRHGLSRLMKVVMSVVAIIFFGFVNNAYAGQDVFTTPGSTTWTAPTGAATVTEVMVQAWGAGGGGGGDGATNGSNDNFGAAGGGGGAFATGTASGVFAGSAHDYTVGAGGTAGSDNPGGDGGTSFFINGTTVGAAGGGGGGGNNGALGAGGTVTGGTGYIGGDGSVPTQGGSAGKKKGGAGGGSAGPANAGSSVTNEELAAAAVAGGGAGGDGGLASAAGTAGGQPGGGGGGGGNGTTTGGSGASGKVIINWKPQVIINQAAGQDEITNAPINFDVVFSENVTGFAAGDITLSGTSGTKSVTNVSGSGANYTITVTVTGANGTVIADVDADAADDPYANTSYASTSTDNQVTYTNATTPTVTITNAYGGPTNDTTLDFTVTFSADVIDFNDLTDISLAGSTAPAAVTSISPVSASVYDVVVTVSDDGDVVASIPGSVATGGGLPNDPSPGSSTVTFDDTKPDVSISYGGNDPESSLPIIFDVLFTEDVIGFVAGDVTLSGTATGLEVSSIGGSGTTYTIVVDDAGGPPPENGSVIVNIANGGALDPAGNTSNPATITKNTVAYTGGSCPDTTPSSLTFDPPGASVGGAAVDLTTLFTFADLGLFTYTIDDSILAPFTIDTPWNSSAYGTGGPEVVNLEITGIDPDCGTPFTLDQDITIDNSAVNFLMHNSVTTGSDKWPTAQSLELVGGWGIADAQYGEFTCGTCHTKNTGNIKRVRNAVTAPSGENFPGGAASPVALASVVDGASDFGDDDPNDDLSGRPTSNRICEVCHSQNKYHNYNTTNNAPNGGDLVHENQNDCVTCHPHNTGFKDPGCTGCHGDPPTSSANMVFNPGGPDATGALADSTTAPGAHNKHAVSKGIECLACHKGNTMPAPSSTIEMGFDVNPATFTGFASTITGGTLAAPEDSRLANGYTFTASTSAAADVPPTVVTKVANDNFVCSNIYCHGSWSNNAGTNNTPSWVGVDQATCGSCHGATGANPPQTGSHVAHASNSGVVKLACNSCHPAYSDTAHLDGDVAWQMDTADPRIGSNAKYRGLDAGLTGSNAPSGTFGTCTTVYCHGSNSPNWGSDVGNITCESCHPADDGLASSHPVHYDSTDVVASNTTGSNSIAGAYVFECGNCHDPATTTHAGGVVSGNQHAQVALPGGGSYNAGGSTAGSDGGIFNYTAGTCNFNACHQDGRGGIPNDTATWGSNLPVTCTGCHNNDLASTEPMASNAHNVHVSDATVMSVKPCQMCHVSTVDTDNRTILDKSLHLDGTRDVTILDTWDSDLDPTDNYTPGVGCDLIYCHSNGQSSLTYNPVSWSTTIGCDGCHDDANTTSNLTSAHLSHIGTDPSDTNKQFGYSCTACHVQTAASNIAIGNVTNHINKLRDVSIDSVFGGDDTINTNYTGYDNFDGGPYADTDSRWPQAASTCDSTLCHGSGSPQWTVGTTTGDCSTCHGMSKTSESAPGISVMDTEGHTADSDRQVGAHATHLNALNNYSAPITCDNCHNTTVSAMNTKGTYVEKVKVAGHNDTAGPAEITFANLATKFATQPAVYAGGTGSCNAYCHGGVNVGMLAGANNDPLWDQNAYLVGDPTAAGDCSKCHYAPPPGKGHLGNEEIVWTDTGPKSCGTANCHEEVMNTDGTFKDANLHVNGVTNTTATCTTCHITMPPNTGSHQKHFIHLEQDLSLFVGLDVQPTGDGSVWNEANYPLCASCHDMNDEANDHFGDTSQIMGVNKKSETFSNTPLDYPEFDDVDKNCYNVRCHFQATPDWYNPTVWPSWP